MPKKSTYKNRMFRAVGAVIALSICLLICQYISGVFFGNRQWSLVLFIIGLVALAIAAIIDGRKVMICTVIGYIGGFGAGIIFATEGVDPGGGATNNWWQIWTLSFLAMICVGAVWEALSRRAK